MRVLILGGGNAATRYAESLVWDSDINLTLCNMGVFNKTKELGKKLAISCIDYNSLNKNNINNYDCIIITLPPSVKRKYVESIVNDFAFKGSLILEKPLCTNRQDLIAYNDCLNKLNKVAIVCQRDFDIDNYKIQKSNLYEVNFKSITDDLEFNIINQLPHILSWFYTNGIIFNNSKVENNQVVLTSDKSEIRINFSSKFVDFNTTINGILYGEVNYRKLNSLIVKKVLNYNKSDSIANIKKAIYVSQIIVELLN